MSVIWGQGGKAKQTVVPGWVKYLVAMGAAWELVTWAIRVAMQVVAH